MYILFSYYFDFVFISTVNPCFINCEYIINISGENPESTIVEPVLCTSNVHCSACIAFCPHILIKQCLTNSKEFISSLIRCINNLFRLGLRFFVFVNNFDLSICCCCSPVTHFLNSSECSIFVM